MKKKFATIFSSLALVAMLIATLCACSTYGSVKSKYESNGWTENEDCVKLQETLLKMRSARTMHKPARFMLLQKTVRF